MPYRKTIARAEFLHRPIVRYGLAVLAIGLAFLLRLSLTPILGAGAPFVTFYPAVMLAATIGGVGPGILATALTVLLVQVWVLPPTGHFQLAGASDAVSLLVFAAMGVLMSAVAEMYYRVRRRVAGFEKDTALRRTEEQFRAMVDSIPQLAWMAQPDGYIFWYNQRWYDYTGKTEQEMEGWGWQSVHDPSALPTVIENWRASLSTGARFEMEFPLRRADGQFRWFLTRVVPVRDAEGSVVRWFGTNTDITERKRSEQEREELEAHKRDFYRKTILAATDGKLLVTDHEDIETSSGQRIASWDMASLEDVAEVRDHVERLARNEGMDEDRVYDLIGCVVESAGNAVKHASYGTASLYRGQGMLVFVVSDCGAGIGAMAIPDVALARGYSTAGTLGMGYKVMINFADRVCLATGIDGTMVAVELSLHGRPDVRETIEARVKTW